MFLKLKPEEVLSFPLVPVRGVDLGADARNRNDFQGQLHKNLDPAGAGREE